MVGVGGSVGVSKVTIGDRSYHVRITLSRWIVGRVLRERCEEVSVGGESHLHVARIRTMIDQVSGRIGSNVRISRVVVK